MADDVPREKKEPMSTPVAKAAAVSKGLDKYARHDEVIAKIKEFCENPDNFTVSGPRTLYDLATTLGIGQATMSRNLQLMNARRDDPKVPEEEKFAPCVRFWHHRNAMWVWCAPR